MKKKCAKKCKMDSYDIFLETPNKTLSNNEIDALKILVQFFHSFYYGRDKVGSFSELRNIINAGVKKKNQTILDELKKTKLTEEELEVLWSKIQ